MNIKNNRNKKNLLDDSNEIIKKYNKDVLERIDNKDKYEINIISIDSALQNIGISINKMNFCDYSNMELPIKAESFINRMIINTLEKKKLYSETVTKTNQETDIIKNYSSYFVSLFDSLDKNSDEYLLVLERQPDINEVTKKINSIIMSIFETYCLLNNLYHNILIIDSSIKFMVYESTLDHSKLSSSINNYSFNKKYSIYEMNSLLKLADYKLEKNIKNDDMADAFCMSIFVIKSIFSSILYKRILKQ